MPVKLEQEALPTVGAGIDDVLSHAMPIGVDDGHDEDGPCAVPYIFSPHLRVRSPLRINVVPCPFDLSMMTWPLLHLDECRDRALS